jgi:hypothetical protein
MGFWLQYSIAAALIAAVSFWLTTKCWSIPEEQPKPMDDDLDFCKGYYDNGPPMFFPCASAFDPSNYDSEPSPRWEKFVRQARILGDIGKLFF